MYDKYDKQKSKGLLHFTVCILPNYVHTNFSYFISFTFMYHITAVTPTTSIEDIQQKT